MLVNLNEIFRIAEEKEIAIGAFNAPTLEMVRGVIAAAEKNDLPVILQHTEGHNKFISMEEISNIMLFYANRAKVPVCVHLDHGTSYEDCKRAIELGFTSVMFDGSMYNYETNIELTQKVVKIAHEHNVSVEAELGPMLNSTIGAGEGINYLSSEYRYTEVSEASDFVNLTNVDCLAIAVGTMHGIYVEKPKLNLNRIKEIKDSIHLPLVLHGGSGLEIQEYVTAVKNGIRKINYYTYMNCAGGNQAKKFIEGSSNYIFFDELSLSVTKAIENEVNDFIRIISNK